jgi:hypothetical protein
VKRTRLVGLGGLVLLGLAALAAAQFAGAFGQEDGGRTLGTRTISSAELTVLRAGAEAGRAPSARSLDAQSRAAQADPASLRYARSSGNTSLFVAHGQRTGDVCLVIEDTAEDSTATVCALRKILATGAIYLTKPDDASGTFDLYALVGDGVRWVGDRRPERNVVVARGLSDTETVIVLRNAAGQESTVDLGPQ